MAPPTPLMSDPLDIEKLQQEIDARRPSPEECTLLIIDDDEAVATLLREMLVADGYTITSASTATAGLEAMERDQPMVVLVDKNLPDVDGLEVVRGGKARCPNAEFIVITGYGSIDSAIEALELGAFGYLLKPFTNFDKVRGQIRAALDHNWAVRQNVLLTERIKEALGALQKATADLDRLNEELEKKVAARTRELQAVIQDVIKPLASVEDDMQVLYAFIVETSVTGGGGQAGRAKMALDVLRTVRNRADQMMRMFEGGGELTDNDLDIDVDVLVENT